MYTYVRSLNGVVHGEIIIHAVIHSVHIHIRFRPPLRMTFCLKSMIY